MNQKLEIRTTEDGSHTIYSSTYDSTYHSMHGAIQESDHIFIQNGLKYYLNKINKEEIKILEIGFGTGLNAFLSLYTILGTATKLNYHALEKHPLPKSLWNQLNYPEILDFKGSKETFFMLHEELEHTRWINEHFSLLVNSCDFDEVELIKDQYDIIYFDPFDPGVQNHLWEGIFLQKLKKSLCSSGILITYGAKGSFKRELKSLNFQVDSLPGPPGKREITRATSY